MSTSSSERPAATCFRSSRGVPSATSRPPERKPIRSQSCSASSMSWVVSRMVVCDSRRTSVMKAWTSRLLRGSRPVVGSSSSMSRGDGKEGPSHGHLLLLPSRQVQHRLPNMLVVQTQSPQDGLAFFPDFRTAHAVGPAEEEQVLERRHRLEKGRVSGHPVKQRPDGAGLFSHVVPENPHLASVR